MRLFIAINLPADLKQRLFDRTAPLRTGGYPFRWVLPSAMHVTLKFLGEVEDTRTDAVREKLAALAGGCERFELSLAGVGAFPDLRRPRVLWIGVSAGPVVYELQQRIEQSMAMFGFESDNRAYRPHLTLARASRDARGSAFSGLQAVAESIAGEEETATITGIDLMRSKLGRGGAQYETVDCFPLYV